jgi:hypothetical protein
MLISYGLRPVRVERSRDAGALAWPRALAARSKEPVPCWLAPDSALSRFAGASLDETLGAGCLVVVATSRPAAGADVP